MINGRTLEGSYLITAVGHPESFWRAVEERAGRRLSVEARRALTAAMDAPPSTWAPDNWSYAVREPRGFRTADAYRADEQTTFMIKKPPIFVRWTGA